MFILFFQICIPTATTPFYKCICKAGFEVNPSTTYCETIKAPKFLLYGQQSPGIIRGIGLNPANNINNATESKDVVTPMVDLSRPTALDFHAESRSLLVADSEALKIQRHHLSNGSREDVVTSGLFNVMGLSVESEGNNVYWTDEGLITVNVASLADPRRRKVILKEGLSRPRSILADSGSRRLFWTDWPKGPEFGELQGKIETSNLDGSERKLLLKHELVWPNGLALDAETNTLYWCDSYLKKIESMNLVIGANSRKIVASEDSHEVSLPFGLALHKGSLYWSEFDLGSIKKLDLTSNLAEVFEEGRKKLFGLKIFDSELVSQSDSDVKSPCHESCSDLCLRSGNELKCHCGDGRRMTESGECEAIEDWKASGLCSEAQFQCRHTFKCIDKKFL